jgi:3-hydroxyacyl-[acyl-carrier-protein] dehydratase
MQFTIPADHPCLPGHFPGRPLVPGVVILEQVLLAISRQCEVPLTALRLPQVKFMASLLPGQTATIELEGAAPRWRFKVLHEAQLLVRGELVITTPDAVA